MKKLISSAFFILLVSLAIAQDTGQVRTVNGKKYKVHKVQAGETVYALSRTYEVSAADIMSANPAAGEGLNIGQELLIPVKEQAKGAITHTVAAGETLFAISKRYDVDVEDIQKLNGMNDVALSVGQVLTIRAEESETKPPQKEVKETPAVVTNAPGNYIVQQGETLFAISRKFNVSVEDLMKWNKMESPSINEGQSLIVKAPDSQNTQVSNTTVTQEKVETKVEQKTNPVKVEEEEADVIVDTTPKQTDEFVEVSERGVAELIPDTENTRKYLALHREVQPGTIIRVRNEMNGREVWARVIGKLPETGENKDILVKVSRAAFDRLGAVDKKFRVTITYIP